MQGYQLYHREKTAQRPLLAPGGYSRRGCPIFRSSTSGIAPITTRGSAWSAVPSVETWRPWTSTATQLTKTLSNAPGRPGFLSWSTGSRPGTWKAHPREGTGSGAAPRYPETPSWQTTKNRRSLSKPGAKVAMSSSHQVAGRSIHPVNLMNCCKAQSTQSQQSRLKSVNCCLIWPALSIQTHGEPIYGPWKMISDLVTSSMLNLHGQNYCHQPVGKKSTPEIALPTGDGPARTSASAPAAAWGTPIYFMSSQPALLSMAMLLTRNSGLTHCCTTRAIIQQQRRPYEPMDSELPCRFLWRTRGKVPLCLLPGHSTLRPGLNCYQNRKRRRAGSGTRPLLPAPSVSWSAARRLGSRHWQGASQLRLPLAASSWAGKLPRARSSISSSLQKGNARSSDRVLRELQSPWMTASGYIPALASLTRSTPWKRRSHSTGLAWSSSIPSSDGCQSVMRTTTA